MRTRAKETAVIRRYVRRDRHWMVGQEVDMLVELDCSE
jgi:hypothetical protein